MTIQELIDSEIFTLVNAGDDTDAPISQPFCCDLLSIAMSRAPEKCAWVTVMANMNTLAVSTLTDCGCIILAEGTAFDAATNAKAAMQGITVFTTPMPVFDAALAVWQHLEAEKGEL